MVIHGIAVVLVVGAFIGGGYVVGDLLYSPETRLLEGEVADLESDVAVLEQTVSTLEDEAQASGGLVTSGEDALASLEATVAAHEQTISSLGAQIVSTEMLASSLQVQLDQAAAQLSAHTESLSRWRALLVDAGITLRYRWYHRLQWWDVDLQVPILAYVESAERARSSDHAAYAAMAVDPSSAAYVDWLTQALAPIIEAGDLTGAQTADLVIAFVTGMPYIDKNTTIPYDGNPRYPIETLFERKGDSEDTSILVAALLNRMGYDVALLALEGVPHMAVGVSLPPAEYGSFFSHEGTRYFYLETIQPLGVGSMPSLYAGSAAQVYPVGN